MTANSKGDRRFGASREAILAGLRYALRRLDAVNVSWLPDDTGVEFDRSVSMASWGDRVRAVIEDGGRVVVESRCRFPLQLFDWGNSAKNVQCVFHWIEEYLELFGDGRDEDK